MRLLLIFLCILYFTRLYAKGDIRDTVSLSEVIKVEQASTSIQNYETPFKDLKYKLGERLGDALSEYSSVYIKSYGSGGLASIAVRGTSATQTEIQWNGVKLNSPSLGQVDLSLFIIGMQDELQVVRTGYQGTIGGTLKMDNSAKIDSGFSINSLFRIGSFGTYTGMADVQYGKKGFTGSTKFSYLSSQNNFKYRNDFEEGNPLVRQTNAAVQQYSFLQQLGYKIDVHNQVDVFVWLSGAQRQIPPIMSKLQSKESQDDYSARVMGSWKGTFNKLRLKFTCAYLYDQLHYNDPDALLDETSSTQALRNRISASYLFPFNLTWNSELNYDYEQANISQYSSIKSKNIVGFKTYGDYYLLNKFRFHTGFREDLVDTKLSAFAPELSFNYLGKLAPGHDYSMGFMASRNFRFPTLNDLYWTPGGNPGLKEEKSWNGELQAKYSYRKLVDVSLSNFYVYVSNWIQWIPQGSIWMPINFRRVFSRGFEASIHLTNANENRPNQFVFHFNGSYTYTRTTNLDAASQYDLSKGMQLIYVPFHNANASIQFMYRKFYLRSVNTYTGSVFITTDNTELLKGYCLSDIEIGKDFQIKNMELGCSFRLNNVGNIRYQVVAQRPMPGRNFEVTFRFKLM